MPDTEHPHAVAAPEAPLRFASHTIDMSELRLLRQALNLVDYGLVVIDADTAAVQFANAPGLAALQAPPDADTSSGTRAGLRVWHGRVIGCRPSDTELLRRALERTKVGLRDFLCLDAMPAGGGVAVLPLGGPRRGSGGSAGPALLGSAVPDSHALLVFSKQHLCDDSTMALFARERGLTNAEGQVLAQVCKGLRPAQIAHKHGVRISTVRTQLRSIRMKTSSDTIRDLVQKVSVLPPMARPLPGQLQQ